MNELQLQRWIIDQVRDAGGFGKKISNQLQPGVPDLLLSHPAFAAYANPPGMNQTVLAEVKYIKDQLRPGFHRRVDTTPKQKDEMRRFTAAGGLACVLVFYEYYDKKRYLAGVHWSTDGLVRSETHQPYGGRWVSVLRSIQGVIHG